MSVSHFEIIEREGAGGSHVVLAGELDLASACPRCRLWQLAADIAAIRLGLSTLEFIDSTAPKQHRRIDRDLTFW